MKETGFIRKICLFSKGDKPQEIGNPYELLVFGTLPVNRITKRSETLGKDPNPYGTGVPQNHPSSRVDNHIFDGYGLWTSAFGNDDVPTLGAHCSDVRPTSLSDLTGETVVSVVPTTV